MEKGGWIVRLKKFTVSGSYFAQRPVRSGWGPILFSTYVSDLEEEMGPVLIKLECDITLQKLIWSRTVLYDLDWRNGP